MSDYTPEGYDAPVECEICPTCGAELMSNLECYRCDRDKLDKAHGTVTIDESNQAKRMERCPNCRVPAVLVCDPAMCDEEWLECPQCGLEWNFGEGLRK